MSNSASYDVAIIGGGPAGLSAAIWLGRYLHRVLLIDSGDPRNWETRGVNGYLGRPRVLPAELRGEGRDEARRFGAELVDGEVRQVERLEEERFRITYEALRVRPRVENGRGTREGLVVGSEGVHIAEARRILLAFGIRDIWPDIEGLERCYGDTVHHCPDCDGHEAIGCRTVVVASGRKAAGMALALATWTREIVICTNGEPADIDAENLARLDALGIPILEQRALRMVSRGSEARQLELENGMSLDCERLFFAIGHVPADDLGAQLGCERDEEGLIVVDSSCHSSVRNVYAAGDIVPGPHLAIRAASDGAIAALAIHKSLLPELQRLA
ncbi:MAG TPA: NAD(P)/FAD-dependent oxidoreductase [Gemmatimonadaceae bacterium]|nr:NAD(P)/FAD-dependent oxidoreductase [Gemmatimonadaceae bacterium]